MYNPYIVGTWQQFVKRSDNAGLTTEQMRGKYVYEQFLFEQAMMQTVESVSSAGGGSAIDLSINGFVEDDYIDDYIE
jgi:hypothetical protein